MFESVNEWVSNFSIKEKTRKTTNVAIKRLKKNTIWPYQIFVFFVHMPTPFTSVKSTLFRQNPNLLSRKEARRPDTWKKFSSSAKWGRNHSLFQKSRIHESNWKTNLSLFQWIFMDNLVFFFKSFDLGKPLFFKASLKSR